MEAIIVVLSILASLGAFHLFGSTMLALTYSAKAEFNQYPVSKMFAFKWIIITGLPGFIASGDEEDGLFWRHIRARMDADRTNAYDIADCKANLRRLERLPHTDATRRAIGTESRRLVTLRAHDNEVTSMVGLSVLAPDLAATRESSAASRQILDEIRGRGVSNS